MIPARARLAALCGCVAMLCGPPWAFGQVNTAVVVNRPSDQAASVSGGRVGGLYTGRWSSGAITGLGRPQSVAAIPSSFRGRGLIRRDAIGMGINGSLLDGSAPGASGGYSGSIRARYRNPLVDPGIVARSELMVVSGYSSAIDVNTPLLGWSQAPRPLKTPLYARPVMGDSFQQFFGLKPPVDQSPAGDVPTVATLLGRANEDKAGQMWTRALTAFMEGRWEEATSLLSAVRDVEPRTHMPSVLLAHAALESGRVYVATNHLLDALRRRPGMFVEGLKVRDYYKDAATFERQLVTFSRLSDAGKEWQLSMIKSYCAWQLGDMTTARSALDELRAFANSEDGRIPAGAVNAFAKALGAAIR